MFPRTLLKALFLASFVVSLIGCATNQVDSITVTPGTDSTSIGKVVQYTATATVGHAGHAPKNVTNTVNWSSSDTTVATVSATGLATAVGSGSATITASIPGFGGLVSGTAAMVVTGSGTVGSNFASIKIVPNTQGFLYIHETGQFIALGVNADGTEQDITSLVSWTSSDIQVATVDASGLATGLNSGGTTVVAKAKNPDGSVLTGTANLTESATGTGLPQIATLTVYKVGPNATVGIVTAPDPNTGQAGVIDCGTGTGCVGNFPIGSQVTLTATPATGSTFAGWSSNCSPTNLPPPPGQYTCTVTLTDNDTVGAIFD